MQRHEIGNTRYTDRYIAYMDILGFRALVEESRTDPDAFDAARRALQTPALQHSFIEDLKKFNDDGRRMYMFSDSILLTTPPSEEGLSYLVDAVAKLSNGFISSGVFLRGAIVRGDLFEDGPITFGPGLVHAHEIESKAAIYPRILVEKNIVERAATILYHPKGREPMTLHHRLRKDEHDEWYFVDWLRHYHVLYGPEATGFRTDSPLNFELIRSMITWSLAEFKDCSRILAKTTWFAEYFNSTLTEGKDLNILGRNKDLACVDLEQRRPLPPPK